MPPTNKQQQFSNEATTHDLPDSVDDVGEMHALKKEVEQKKKELKKEEPKEKTKTVKRISKSIISKVKKLTSKKSK
mgnify:CR=1 FL=1